MRRSGGLLYFDLQQIHVRTELADSMVTLGKPRDGLELFGQLDVSSSSKCFWRAVGCVRYRLLAKIGRPKLVR